MEPDESTPVMVRLNADQLRTLDDWRRQQEDLPSRPEAIRRLVDVGYANALQVAFEARIKRSRKKK